MKKLINLLFDLIGTGIIDKEEIDIAIFLALEEYVGQEKAHIVPADVLSVQEDIMKDYGMYGYYSKIGSRCSVTLDEQMTKYIDNLLISDKNFINCIDTMIHEHRHAYQYAYCLDVIYADSANKYDSNYDYDKDATEIDAKQIAKELIPDACNYVYDYLINLYK